MGGCGSGQTGGKAAVEDCITISAGDLLRWGYLKESAAPGSIYYRNALGGLLYVLNFEVAGDGEWLALCLRRSKQTVWLESTPLNFGGRRWWFRCPGCDRRCAALYKPLGVECFACRLCHDLTYRSCQESGSAPCGLPAGAVAMARRSLRPRWVRKRDRRPDYRPRDWRLQEMKKQLGIWW